VFKAYGSGLIISLDRYSETADVLRKMRQQIFLPARQLGRLFLLMLSELPCVLAVLQRVFVCHFPRSLSLSG
jgi:hypothetical protein